MTERESAHPLQAPLCDFSPTNDRCENTNVQDMHEDSNKTCIEKNNTNDEAVQQPLKTTVNQVKQPSNAS